MATGRLRAVVCTSSLDLGVDWGDVDLVINVGAPKGASRLLQRIGRANHRMDEPSKGVLVPANRFEVLECRAALDAIAENAQERRRCAPAGSTCWPSTCSAAPAARRFQRRTVRRSDDGRALRRAHARRFRRRRSISSRPAVCARPMTASPVSAGQGRPLAHRQSAGGATLPA